MNVLMDENLRYDSRTLQFEKPLVIKNMSEHPVHIKIKMNNKKCLSLSSFEETIKPTAAFTVHLKLIQKPSPDLKLQVIYHFFATHSQEQKIILLKPIPHSQPLPRYFSDPLIQSNHKQQPLPSIDLYPFDSTQNPTIIQNHNKMSSFSDFKQIQLPKQNDTKQSRILKTIERNNLQNAIIEEKNKIVQLQQRISEKRNGLKKNIRELFLVIISSVLLGAIASSFLQGGLG